MVFNWIIFLEWLIRLFPLIKQIVDWIMEIIKNNKTELSKKAKLEVMDALREYKRTKNLGVLQQKLEMLRRRYEQK